MKRRLFKLFIAAKKLSRKKHHLDFIVAILTIPVLLSVIVLNYTNLQNIQKNKNNLTPVPTQTEKIIVIPQKTSTSPLVESLSCIKDIGPINISFPTENQTTSDSPLCINVKYTDPNYCSVVWSYRINNSAWSEFTGNNPCIYNLQSGNVKFDLRVQSTVVQKEEDLTRNFIYRSTSLSPTPTATSSANL